MAGIRKRLVFFQPSLALTAAIIAVSACTDSTEPRNRTLAHLDAVTPTELRTVVGTLLSPGPAVRASDSDGKPLSGVQVSFTTSGDDPLGGGTFITDDAGIASVAQWKIGHKAGAHLLTARSDSFTVSFKANADAGPVASLLAAGGDWQKAVMGTTLPAPLLVKAVDAFSNPITGAVVTFSVETGGGNIAADTALTGPDGVASLSRWTLGTKSGTQEVWAKSGKAYAVFTALTCDESTCLDMLFVRAGNIYSFGSQGVRELADRGNNGQPAWSPDGQRIAFARTSGSMAVDTYVMNADGSNLQRVTSGSPFHHPAWSPDGQSLALAGDWWACIYDCSIYTLKLTDPTPTVQKIAPMGTDPDWSPDGAKIVYVSLSGDDGYQALYSANADGSDISELTPRDEGALFGPKWSPDGKKIAFSKCIAASCDIYLLDYGTSVVTQVTSVGQAYYPTWSQDGSLIAFTRGTSDPYAPSSIEYIPVTGTVEEPIHLLSDAYSPSWRR